MVELDNDQISDPTWLEGLKNIKNKKSRNFLKNPEIILKIYKLNVGGLIGSKTKGMELMIFEKISGFSKFYIL